MARWIIITGILLVITGFVLHIAPGIFNWFGKLPGDINIKTGANRLFIPITSMILISLILTILLNIFKR